MGWALAGALIIAVLWFLWTHRRSAKNGRSKTRLGVRHIVTRFGGRDLTLDDFDELLRALLKNNDIELVDQGPTFRHYFVTSRKSIMGYLVAVHYYQTRRFRPARAPEPKSDLLGLGLLAWWGAIDTQQLPRRYRRMRAVPGAVTQVLRNSIEISSERYYHRRDVRELVDGLLAWHNALEAAWRDLEPLIEN